MSAIIIPAGKSLLEEILPRLACKERDYSSNIVVFPGKRPSHFLRKALAAKIKRSFIPPRVFSMDGFVDSVYEKSFSRKKAEALDAVALLYDIHRKASTRLGGNGFMTPDSFFPLGLKIYRDLEELLIEDINPVLVRDIEPLTQEAIPEQTLKRLQSLSFFYEEFYKEIERLGLSTRALRYCRAARDIGAAGMGEFEQIIFAGFFALTKSEKTLFRKLSSENNIAFLFSEGAGIREKITESGLKINESKKPEKEKAEPEIHFYSSPDTHGQVFSLSKVIEDLPGENKTLDENNVIVLPAAETLFPLIRHGLPVLSEDSYNISMGYPVYRTPVFGFLNNLMELITSMDGDRIYIPDYLKFILHPYTKNIYYRGNAEITRVMFHSLEETLLRQKARTFLTLSEIEKDENTFKAIMDKLLQDNEDITAEAVKEHLKTIHGNTIGKILSLKDLGDFAARCIEVLTYISGNSTARLHPFFHPFAESLVTALDLLQRSLIKATVFTETGSYFIFFRKYLRTCHTPFEGTPLKGLQVLGFLETRNLKFDRVFILDANEDILPDTKKEDTLMPFRAREILGLPTYMDLDKLAGYYFETLLNGARQVHIFFREDDARERSRFVERLLWERQKKDGIQETGHYIAPAQYQVRLENREPAEAVKTEAMVKFLRAFSFSATALDKYLKCPLQFYYTYLLRFGKKDGISGDLKRDAIGSFVHRVLAEYFSKRKGYPLKESDINLKELSLLIDRLFAAAYGESPSGSAYLLKRQIKLHLSDFLRQYYGLLIRTEGVTILDTERTIEIKTAFYNLKGRPDMIEKRGEAIIIIDYKTGSNPDYLKIRPEKLELEDRSSWGPAIGSLQLPFYLMLYSERTGLPTGSLNAMFLLLGRSGINREIELSLFDRHFSEDTYEKLKAVIFRLIEEIVNPELPFIPAEDKKKSCPACDFQYLCGTQWITK